MIYGTRAKLLLKLAIDGTYEQSGAEVKVHQLYLED